MFAALHNRHWLAQTSHELNSHNKPLDCFHSVNSSHHSGVAFVRCLGFGFHKSFSWEMVLRVMETGLASKVLCDHTRRYRKRPELHCIYEICTNATIFILNDEPKLIKKFIQQSSSLWIILGLNDMSHALSTGHDKITHQTAQSCLSIDLSKFYQRLRLFSAGDKNFFLYKNLTSRWTSHSQFWAFTENLKKHAKVFEFTPHRRFRCCCSSPRR